MDCAKHRRRKAAAKMHLRFGLRSFLPCFVVVKSAGSHDSKEARTVCSGVNSGKIYVLDKAYLDFKLLYDLLVRGIFLVTHAKTNMKYEVMGQQVAKRKCVQPQIAYLPGFS